MAVSFVAVGSQASGTGAITAALPSGIQTDDLLLLVVESANQAITVNTSGWTELTSSPQGTGTAGGTAATELAVYWRWVDGTETNTRIADSGDHTIAAIGAYRGVYKPAPFNAQAGAVNATASTTCTFPTVTTTVDDCLVLLMNARALPDSNTNAQTTNHTNANLSGLAANFEYNTNAGNGGGFCVESGLKATAGAVGTSTATNSVSTVTGVITLALTPAPDAQALTPDLFTNTNAFFGPVVESGAVNLQPSLYSNAQTVYAATVDASYSLTAARYDNSSTVYGPTVVKQPYLLTASPVEGTQVFYAPSIGRGPVGLSAARYDNAQVFYGPTVLRGAIALQPPFIGSTATVYAPTVENVGGVDIQVSWVTFDVLASNVFTLRPGLYENTNAFYGVSLGRGAINLQPGLYSSQQTFYTPTVGRGGVTLQPARFNATNAFYSPTVGSGALVLSPARVDNSSTFLGGVVSQGGLVIQAPRLDNGNVFFSATVGSRVTLLPTLAQNESVFYTATLGNIDDKFLLFENWVDPGWVEGGWQSWPYSEPDQFFPAVLTRTGGADNRHEVEFTDTAPRLWWQRRPKAMPEEVAEEKVAQVANVIRRVAKAQVGKDAPQKQLKREVREAIEPLVAEMPGFDWVTLWRFINVQVALDEQRRREEMALILAQQAWERDEEDALVLLMAA
jgi:adhesin HecA-like repeat protein